FYAAAVLRSGASSKFDKRIGLPLVSEACDSCNTWWQDDTFAIRRLKPWTSEDVARANNLWIYTLSPELMVPFLRPFRDLLKGPVLMTPCPWDAKEPTKLKF
ncbi:MAG: hypothetical protein N2C14_24415, partial [Planctomycetales bacterium]